MSPNKVIHRREKRPGCGWTSMGTSWTLLAAQRWELKFKLRPFLIWKRSEVLWMDFVWLLCFLLGMIQKIELWLKNMFLVRSVQRVFEPWQPPGRVVLNVIVMSVTIRGPKKSQNIAFWKLWLISRSVGVILPTTAYILRLKNPPVR